jgi:hypothetical protein
MNHEAPWGATVQCDCDAHVQAPKSRAKHKEKLEDERGRREHPTTLTFLERADTVSQQREDT